jgi:hypothetical protein
MFAEAAGQFQPEHFIMEVTGAVRKARDSSFWQESVDFWGITPPAICVSHLLDVGGLRHQCDLRRSCAGLLDSGIEAAYASQMLLITRSLLRLQHIESPTNAIVP